MGKIEKEVLNRLQKRASGSFELNFSSMNNLGKTETNILLKWKKKHIECNHQSRGEKADSDELQEESLLLIYY